MLVPFVALAVAALCARVDGQPRPVRTVLRAGRFLWILCAALMACWAVLYLAAVQSRPLFQHMADASRLIGNATSLGLFPAVAGGPVHWDRWPPSPPWAAPT